MAAHLGALIEIQSSSQVSSPAAVLRRNEEDAKTATSSNHELAELQPSGSITQRPGAYVSSPATTKTSQPLDIEMLSATPGTPLDELELDAPVPPQHIASEVVASLTSPRMNKWRFMCACVMFLSNGMSDSAPGALIPYIEDDFHIGYAIVSLVFVANALGFIIAAPMTHWLESRFGRARAAMFCQVPLIAGYVIIVCKPPFPVVVFSFFLLGLGIAPNLALNNVFLANLANATELLGTVHGFYGVGGTLAPLIATTLVSHGVHWTYFYLINSTLAVVNLFLAGWAFRGYEKDMPVQPLLAELQRTGGSHQEAEQQSVKRNMIWKALKSKVTLLGALFIFAYQGAEVAISGWIVSFLINYRNGAPAHVGYVSSGFWAGVTVGRFVLSYPARRLGEKLAVFILVAGSIIFQIMCWVIPNIIGDAVAVAIVGLFLGPIIPCATVILNRLLPRDILTTSLGFASAMGSSGGAIAPFVTGMLAQTLGTVVLHPVCLVLYGVMIIAWYYLPRTSRREE
jgi:fucose permease